MINYNKQEVRNELNLEDIYQLLADFGGEPSYTSFGILSATICHNHPGIGSHKLYYYSNSGLFRCYTGCDSYFDIFELVMKVQKIQHDIDFDLNDAIRWVAQRFNIAGTYEEDEVSTLEDWEILDNYSRIQEIDGKNQTDIVLKEYDSSILDRFNYDVKIGLWLNEGIAQSIMDFNHISYYPGGNQIVIPHYDENNRLVGIRGRTVVKEDAERYGKYRPLKVNGIQYNHPLGTNLYNYNHSKSQIKRMGIAIVMEGEKSVLKAQSYFGLNNDIYVACCGSSLSSYQVYLLLKAGVKEIVIAFDRQFQEIGDDEFQHLKRNLLKLRQRYNNDAMISFIFDKEKITGYKDSPVDKGPDVFLKLFKERIVL